MTVFDDILGAFAAVAVRFLTKRFIGEYCSGSGMYVLNVMNERRSRRRRCCFCCFGLLGMENWVFWWKSSSFIGAKIRGIFLFSSILLILESAYFLLLFL